MTLKADMNLKKTVQRGGISRSLSIYDRDGTPYTRGRQSESLPTRRRLRGKRCYTEDFVVDVSPTGKDGSDIM